MRASLLLTLILVAPALAQPRAGEPIAVNLTPAAPPSPSLKYRLLPPPSEMLPGNAAAGYYRALAMLVEYPTGPQDLRKEHWSEWQSKPLADLPLDEVRGKLTALSVLLREVEFAARRRGCDWGLDGRPEGMGLPLSDAQAYRNVAAVLAVKARSQIAARDFDGALHTLQTGFALGRHLGAAPAFIHILIGAAITAVMQRQLDDLIQQPGAPNLYWALTALPRPYLPLGHALREQPDMVERTLPWLRKLDGSPWTDEQVKAAHVQTRKMFDDFAMRHSDDMDENNLALIESAYEGAKKGLEERGMPTKRIEAMPKFQAVALHAVREFRLAWDEVAKWDYVPGGWRHPAFAKDAERYKEAVARLDLFFFRGLLRGLSDGLDPPAPRIVAATGRIERRFAAQRCLEAIRAYAAAHDGKLPAKLDDITDLPVPIDPVLNQPFGYTLAGVHNATLSAPAPPDDRDNKTLSLTCELTLKPGK